MEAKATWTTGDGRTAEVAVRLITSKVLDADGDIRQKPDVMIEGEGFSEFATRRGGLVSVKARLEIKAKDRATDKVIAVDRQTAVVVDLTDQIAGKNALQSAAAQIAERLLPVLVK